MSDDRNIRAPFSPEVISKLMRWQSAGTVHEATCPNNHYGNRVLRVSASGMRCPSCGYVQTFAPVVMLSEPPRKIAGG